MDKQQKLHPRVTAILFLLQLKPPYALVETERVTAQTAYSKSWLAQTQ